MNSPGPHARRRQAPAIIEGPVVVAGATGNVGRELVPLLLRSDIEQRALSRIPARDTFEADLTNRSTLDRPLNAARAVFLAAPIPVLAEATRNLSTAAVASRSVQRFALCSHHRSSNSMMSTPRSPLAVRPKTHSCRADSASPSSVPDGSCRTSFTGREPFAHERPSRSPPRGPQALIDRIDIALVATVALAGRAPEVCTLTGPEVLTPVEQINVLGEVIGRELTWIERPLADDDRATAFLRDDVRWAKATKSIQQLTGSQSQTFRDWASRHAGNLT